MLIELVLVPCLVGVSILHYFDSHQRLRKVAQQTGMPEGPAALNAQDEGAKKLAQMVRFSRQSQTKHSLKTVVTVNLLPAVAARQPLQHL